MGYHAFGGRAHEKGSQIRLASRAKDDEVRFAFADVLQDAIVVTILEGQDRRRETIPFADIRKIDEVRGHALRNVLIGVGIGVAVLFGTCAAALSSETAPRVEP